MGEYIIQNSFSTCPICSAALIRLDYLQSFKCNDCGSVFKIEGLGYTEREFSCSLIEDKGCKFGRGVSKEA